jgi:hypothetical protein
VPNALVQVKEGDTWKTYTLYAPEFLRQAERFAWSLARATGRETRAVLSDTASKQ